MLKIQYNPTLTTFIGLLPITFSWILTGSFILFYLFDMIVFIQAGDLGGLNDFLVMLMWGLPAGVTVSFSGMFIDKFPHYLGKLTALSIFGASLSLIVYLFAISIQSSFTLLISISFLGFFTGIMIISGQTVYGTVAKWSHRGRMYSIVMFVFTLGSVALIIITEILKQNFFLPFSILSVSGIIIALIFYYYMVRLHSFWENDPWPTKLMKILVRPSVIAYFLTHTLVWTMLGLTIGSLAQAGNYIGYTQIFGLEVGSYKSFWILVLIGSATFVILFGIISDIVGRKKLIISAVYGVIFASLIIGLFTLDSMTFRVSALLIGVSFALIHPTLDSALWIELSPKDSLGRYISLAFQSLGLGFIIGFLVSYFLFLDLLPEILAVNVFILVGLGVLAVLPLFFCSDSFPPLEFFLLLVINDAGIPVFSYDFGSSKNLEVDLPLISGALSAVGSFMVEATGDKAARLNLVRHGSHFILSEESKLGLSAAIFSNKNDPELQLLLKDFLTRFERRFSDQIANWRGNLDEFKDAINEAEEIFGPLITIQEELLIPKFS